MKGKHEVLIVDDERETRQTLKRAFDCAGWRTRSAANARQALRCLRRSDVAVMIVDVELPGMSGMELINISRAICVDTEVVVIAGHGNIEWAIVAMKSGAVDFLVKPFELSQVLGASERALERRRLRLSAGAGEAPGIDQRAIDGDTAGKSRRPSAGTDATAQSPSRLANPVGQ